MRNCSYHPSPEWLCRTACAILMLALVACQPEPAIPTATPTLPAPTPTPVRIFVVPTVSEASTATAIPSPTMFPTLPEPSHQLRLEVIAAIPHDTGAFTQGLLYSDGLLYESTGEHGTSTVREVDPASGEVLRNFALSDDYFAEGLALVGDRLIQLTWLEHTAFIYDVATFEPLGSFTYEGEGWGLCFDGTTLYMSDGSSTITVRDPVTFEPVGALPVTLYDQPLFRLNELECVGEVIYANVWHTDIIVRIDKATGEVTAVIDASGLLTPDQQAAAGYEGVLNGIAYNPADDTFFITGKLWPLMFKVRLVP